MPRNIAISLLAVFLAATGVLVYFGDKYDVSAPATAAPSPPTTTSPAAPEPEPEPELRAGDTNLPAEAIAAASDAPQLVLFSLDGGGSHELWQEYMAAAAQVDARFTAFISGMYLLADDYGSVYQGPGRERGQSAIGFGGSVADVAVAAADIGAAFGRGHTIATHYNGHFCGANQPSGDDWSQADWASELDQFHDFLASWPQRNNVLTDTVTAADGSEIAITDLGPVAAAISGGRTPCMEGEMAALAPVWAARNMTWDASKNLYTGIGWPEQIDGVWEFQIPYAFSPAFDRKVIAMDYNMAAVFSGTDAELRRAAAATYRYWFDEAYDGNRAPVVIAVHSDGSQREEFTAAALELMGDVCGLDDVVCTGFADAAAWLEAQDPQVMADLQARPVVAAG